MYFTAAAGVVPTTLTPTPTGVLSPLIGNEQCRFGIISPYSGFPPPNQLIISGTGGFYSYVVPTDTTIDFITPSGVFWRPTQGGIYTKASFTANYKSQNFISSTDKTAWIQIGVTNPDINWSNI